MNELIISKKEYRDLSSLLIDKKVINTEAEIKIYRGKVFKDIYNGIYEKKSNKKYICDNLYAYRKYLPEEYVIPESYVIVDKEIKGLLLPYVKGTNLFTLLNNTKISDKLKISYLKKVGLLIEKMDQNRKQINNLFINDLHEGNFLITNEGNLKVVDLDSSRILDSRACPSKYLHPDRLIKDTLSKYEIDKKTLLLYATKNSEIFCYIVMILNYLSGTSIFRGNIEDVCYFIDYINTIGIDANLVSALASIVSHDDNVNPVNYLDNLDIEKIPEIRKVLK